MSTFWTEEKVVELRDLVREGRLSATGIGAALGCSRNAVIGKAVRLKLQLQGQCRKPRGNGGRPNSAPRAPTAGDRVRVAIKARRMAVPAISRAAVEPATPAALPAAPVVQTAAPPVAFLAAVEAGTCLFFACDAFAPDGPDMPVCGGERVLGSRYCAFHDRAKVSPPSTERFRRELRRLAA